MKRILTLPACLLSVFSASAINVGTSSVQTTSCAAPTGAIDIYVTGGLPPYTFLWSNGATTEDITGLPAGTYSVTVTDANSDQASGNWDVLTTELTSPSSAQDGHASCVGSMGGQVQVIEWGINGTPPYTYSPSPDGVDPQGDPYFDVPFSPPGSQVQLAVTDANGCTGTLYEYVQAPQMTGGPNMLVWNIHGSCSGGAGGSVTISNINDGSFFQIPQFLLADALDMFVAGDFNAGNSMTFTSLAPGDYHFTRNWDPSGTYMAFPCDGNPFDRVDFTIPDLGPDCGSVSGLVFIDNDQDCMQGGGEVGVPELVLAIEPGPEYIITDAIGHFAFDFADGSYTLAQSDPTLVQLCPANVPVPFNIASNQTVIDLADSSTVPLDLKAFISSSAAHPGFGLSYAVKAKNLGPQVSGPVTLILSFDGVLSYVSASIAPTTVTSTTLVWELPLFTAYQQIMIAAQFDVPAGTALGYPLYASLMVANTLPDANTVNNTANLTTTVSGSFDPNEKVVSPSDIYFLDIDDHLDYTIRFQNTGTDTAYSVVITDTLSEDLDMGSFESGAGSDPFTLSFKPDRVVEWRFENIFLPDSGTNEAASHGFVNFRITPAPFFVGGSYIDNASDIYFDFNEPIHTNTASVLAEFSVGNPEQTKDRLCVVPNPAHDRVRLVLPLEVIGPVSVEVLTLDGRTVMTARVEKDAEFPVLVIAAGSYLLRVQSDLGAFMASFVKY